MLLKPDSQPLYREVTFVTPSIGVQFQISKPEHATKSTTLEVHNTEGVVVEHLNFADSTQWDASALTDGVYILTVQMEDGVIARQKIIVSR